MNIFVPKETHPDETRTAITPETAGKLVKLGADVECETGVGENINVPDSAYTEAGAGIAIDRDAAMKSADIVLRLRKPDQDDVKRLKKGAIHVSYLDPFNEHDLVDNLVEQGVSAISMEMIPRTTLAQKMDALSSQASLAGYVAVLLAAERLDQILPMMMTPAGTIPPARVFIIGAGVAGLQAIATAKRLGARVEAFDTRPVVEEQVQSLGARFVKIDLGKTGEAKGGYAKKLTEEQLQKQRDAMAKHCASADIVITTAQLFGRKAPLIITSDMIRGMKPGSVIVDLAVESGGNVEGSAPGEEIDAGGVKIIGVTNLPGRVPTDASQMYANNLYNLIEHFWNKELKAWELRRDDEILQGCLITHEGEIVNETIKNLKK